MIEDVECEDDDEVVVVHVRPRRPKKRWCGRCEQPASGYENGDGRRRWRGLDLGTVKVFLEADAPRVDCAEHGVTVVAVPWARHGAGFTRDFEDQAAWPREPSRVRPYRITRIMAEQGHECLQRHASVETGMGRYCSSPE